MDDPPEETDGHERAAIHIPVPVYNQAGNSETAERTALILNHCS